MLCGDAVGEGFSRPLREKVLCDDCDKEFRELFSRGRLKVPLQTTAAVRELIAFIATRIYANFDALEGLARRIGSPGI